MEVNLKFLLVDDSVLIRKKLRSILEKCNCKNIFEAENGEIAIELVKQEQPDVVFLDIIMPDKDGIEALKEIKEYNSDIKVVMASSAGTQSHLRKAIELGAYDFIQKPVTLEAVANIIEKIIKE
ncbi:response regulator transcription factor [Schinkia azotoformans]|uniref:response regulator transcription factor n=1 Tax=Schinkia azotoformans TaxID=1454 RepID=UPI002DB881E3|nr:response regulator [Schinkia azotoformans]MEC1717933.1 response regulator [Schinkia azotoformans]MEC1741034.1 response regulator [Schinkia azotoformans]MEC1744179.1 response regulator [Schinkia azotoformans]MEC1756663.1 response regulator [Schinkia azotoformans]MEC1768045.1 response regulator [Schinkia azotoformans]